jgi:superfamily I DNA/RNA helicase
VQDNSELQWRMVARLSEGCRRVVMAGDDDQTIFRWAGAAVDRLIGMPGRERVLGQSWRVPRAVQALAEGLVATLSSRRPKAWRARDALGVVDRWADLEDVDLPGQDILILARNNFILTEQVVPILRARGIIYEAKGQPSIAPETLEAIAGWERLRRGEAVPVQTARAALALITGAPKVPGEDTATVTIDALPGLRTRAIWHDALDRLPAEDMSYLLAARRAGERLNQRPRVRISTIHSAKGAQADHVVLLTEMARRTAEEAERQRDDETRVWYVGCTRARERLSIVGSRSRWSYPF